MNPIITAFKNSPDKGRGFARDMRVRWALEEVGQPYDQRLLSFAEMKQPAHLALHPFGQIPTYEDGDLRLFESGSIVFHIAEQHPGLLPQNPNDRARAVGWMFAALNTVEPPVFERSMMIVLEREKSWFAERMQMIEDRIGQRLNGLAAHLGEDPWLVGDFSAGDLLMIAVLRLLSGTDLLAAHSNLVAYVARGEARPAFQRAIGAQRAVFQAAQDG